MNYLLTGGGTGGHVYPALAIAERIRLLDAEARFLYVGVKGRAEERLVPAAGIPLRCIPATGLPSMRSPLRLAHFALTTGAGAARAMGILVRWRPHVIVGTGGYVSAPVVVANMVLSRLGILRIPVLIHEQNAVPGRLNRVAGAWATVVASTYPSAVACFPAGRVMLSGYPVRMGITAPPSKEDARRSLGIAASRRVVVVFGGSLGSRSINRGIVGALPMLASRRDLLVIHATGRSSRGDYDPVADTDRCLAALDEPPDEACYQRHDYLDPIGTYLAAADAVVCRAGAGTLNELCVVRRAALLVPKANLPGDHQVRNALALQAAGAAEVLYERPVRTAEGVIECLPPDELAARILALIDDPSRLEALGQKAGALATPDAALSLARAVVRLARGEPMPLAPPPAPRPDSQGPMEHLAILSASDLVKEIAGRREGSRSIPPEERAYLAYRADGYMASPSWEARNNGVKLAGLIRHADRVDLLCSFVTERRRTVRPWHAFMGLTFMENGFIRRNSLVSLAQIGSWNQRVREALLCALRDGYYEVRSAGLALARAVAAHVVKDDEIVASVAALTEDPRFEVRAAALVTLGEIGQGSAAVDRMCAHFLDGNWRVRAAAVAGLTRLVERRAMSREDHGRISQAVEGLLPTSTGFRPLFELKDALGGLARALKAVDDVQAPVRTAL